MTHKKSKHINVDEISLAKPQFYSKTGASVGLFYLNKLLEIQTPKFNKNSLIIIVNNCF